MKVTFRCKRSGNTVSFTNEEDIRGLRAHEGYTEVIPNEKEDRKETPEKVLTNRRRKAVSVFD
jgi:hypothetical protein